MRLAAWAGPGAQTRCGFPIGVARTQGLGSSTADLLPPRAHMIGMLESKVELRMDPDAVTGHAGASSCVITASTNTLPTAWS